MNRFYVVKIKDKTDNPDIFGLAYFKEEVKDISDPLEKEFDIYLKIQNFDRDINSIFQELRNYLIYILIENNYELRWYFCDFNLIMGIVNNLFYPDQIETEIPEMEENLKAIYSFSFPTNLLDVYSGIKNIKYNSGTYYLFDGYNWFYGSPVKIFSTLKYYFRINWRNQNAKPKKIDNWCNKQAKKLMEYIENVHFGSDNLVLEGNSFFSNNQICLENKFNSIMNKKKYDFTKLIENFQFTGNPDDKVWLNDIRKYFQMESKEDLEVLLLFIGNETEFRFIETRLDNNFVSGLKLLHN